MKKNLLISYKHLITLHGDNIGRPCHEERCKKDGTGLLCKEGALCEGRAFQGSTQECSKSER